MVQKKLESGPTVGPAAALTLTNGNQYAASILMVTVNALAKLPRTINIYMSTSSVVHVGMANKPHLAALQSVSSFDCL